jgi:methionyl-tRNA formyltransferase
MNQTPHWWRKPRVISVVVDNESWVLPYAEQLVAAACSVGDQASLFRRQDDVAEGIAAFYLGCTKITPVKILTRNRRNLIIHASDLPKGRGFSPLTWLTLAGENKIPVCLIEAVEEVDAGPIIYKNWANFEGHELNDEMRRVMGELHVEMCLRFLNEMVPPIGEKQVGSATIYPRRRPADSQLDPHKPLAQQFNLLRVVDNENYPAFFDLHGHEYIVRIEKREIKNKK